VAKYLKHLVAESSKPLPALGLMLDCRLKFNCLITGAITRAWFYDKLQIQQLIADTTLCNFLLTRDTKA
jgi:hypothetical protein